MLVSIFTWVTFIMLWVAVSLAVGIYIFINSQKHKMNKVLWGVIGLVFNIFGLCAYFIARDKTPKNSVQYAVPKPKSTTLTVLSAM